MVVTAVASALLKNLTLVVIISMVFSVLFYVFWYRRSYKEAEPLSGRTRVRASLADTQVTSHENCALTTKRYDY
jgi:hypothetical protein